MHDLAGLWHLSDETGQFSAPIALPGDGISALNAADLIPDPYFGRNEYDLRWISDRDWLVSRTFEATDTNQTLVLSMLDTVADVSINGQSVLHADSMFRTFRADVSAALKVGENVIALHFRSAPREAAARAARQPFPVPYQADNCPIPHGNMLRKPECDFGWDWNIALAPFGLYGDIYLEPTQGRIADLIIDQDHSGSGVTLRITAHTDTMADGTPLTLSIGDTQSSVQIYNNCATATLHIADPDLWWPSGQGDQPLYTLTATAGDHETQRQIGLRDVTLVTAPDADGTRFSLHINGRATFMKGANWIPADALPSNITQDATRDLLQSAIDANMNMIRVWGGGRYEPDWFYEICDELGLLVWQDFMFACHLYPATDDFLAAVDAEVREQVARLNHHACIALWCGDNELLGALTWYDESRANRDRYLVAYDRLNRTIETAQIGTSDWMACQLRQTWPHTRGWTTNIPIRGFGPARPNMTNT
ncbi:MAG: hypothetical protein AAF216_14865 [Pseudomonadota bacterium]